MNGVRSTPLAHSNRTALAVACIYVCSFCVVLFVRALRCLPAGRSRLRLGAGDESAAGRAAQTSRRWPQARQEHRGRRGLRWPSRESLGGEALAFDIRGSRRVQSC